VTPRVNIHKLLFFCEIFRCKQLSHRVKFVSMGSNFLTTLGIVGSSLLSVWIVLKYVLLGTYRLDGSLSKSLLDTIKAEGRYTWTLSGDFTQLPRYPSTWESFTVLHGIPLFYSRHEKMMTAGWKGKEEQTTVTFPRFMKSHVDELLSKDTTSRTIPVNLLGPYESNRLGEIQPNESQEAPLLDPQLYTDIEEDVVRVLKRETNKTGVILHGPPGNGKSRFVRYLATKYSLPIHVVQFNADWSNHDVMLMFSSVPHRCIVLFEDFDNHFHGRQPAIKNDTVKFTFDSVINSLDGVHNDYHQAIFIMTVNDITKVDESLKDRPSRFKFVREFGPPAEEVRRRILVDENLVKLSKGMSLDKVCLAADQPQALLKSSGENLQVEMVF